MELRFLIGIGQNIRTRENIQNIYSWRWHENNTVRHYEHGWRNMNTMVNDQEILPDFTLDVDMIEEAIKYVVTIYYWWFYFRSYHLFIH